MSDKKLLANDEITAQRVRIVLENGQTEIVTIAKAMFLAREAGTDLVQMNEADEPVCKLLNFSDYKYDLKQAEKAKKKKQRVTAVQVKEIQLSISIQENDIEIKRKRASKFLSEGKQLSIRLRLKGRMKGSLATINLAKEKVANFVERLGDVTVTQEVSLNGDTVSAIVK